MKGAPSRPPDLSQRLRLANRLMAPPGDEVLTLSLTQGLVDWLKGLLAYDPATAAYGRAHFEALAASEWARALRFERELSFIVFRLRGTGPLPDGPESETRVMALRAVVEATQGVLRDGGDALGRLDTLTFAVLLPETGASGTRDVVRRLITAVGTALRDRADSLESVDLCSVTLSRPSVGEKGWRGALDAALRRLHAWPAIGAGRISHLDILPAHSREVG